MGEGERDKKNRQQQRSGRELERGEKKEPNIRQTFVLTQKTGK